MRIIGSEGMDKQTWDDILTIALNSFPNASLGEDNDGQIVIYTDYYLRPSGKYEQGFQDQIEDDVS